MVSAGRRVGKFRFLEKKVPHPARVPVCGELLHDEESAPRRPHEDCEKWKTSSQANPADVGRLEGE